MAPTLLLLLVEDDPTIRLVVQDALSDAGFELLIVETGAGAIDALDEDFERFRGIVTDVNLGDGPTGWDVARRARELRPDIPVVYMSGESNEGWSTYGVPKSTMVSKPFAPVQIVAAITELLNAMDSH